MNRFLVLRHRRHRIAALQHVSKERRVSPRAFGVKQRMPTSAKSRMITRDAGLICEGAVVPVDDPHDIRLGTQREEKCAQAARD